MKNKKRTLKDWIFATRPWSFVVSATPVIATVSYLLWKGYGEQIDWTNAVLALVGIIFFHAAGNVFSDYYDYRNGIDSKEAFCVPTLVTGDFKPSEFKSLAYGLFFVACVIGIIIMIRCGFPLLYIGIPGLILTLLYPKLKFIALGDLNIFVVYGILPMLGTSFCTLGAFIWDTLLLSIPIGLITVAVLHANNTRDIITDKKVGATSFAAVIGEKASMWTYIFYQWTPIVYTIVLSLSGLFPLISAIVILGSVVALGNTKQALKYKTEGISAFNLLDMMAAKLQLVFGILLILSFILDHFML